ncbi:hypothetical protein SMICM17S_01736 [Streptomyces microflavus]
MQEAARWALLALPRLVFHNATFDLLGLDRHLGTPLEVLGPKATDSKIVAHLYDSRPSHEGGYGLRLKELCAKDVDPSAPDTQEDLTKVFHSIGETKASGWAAIDINHPTYRRTRDWTRSSSRSAWVLEDKDSAQSAWHSASDSEYRARLRQKLSGADARCTSRTKLDPRAWPGGGSQAPRGQGDEVRRDVGELSEAGGDGSCRHGGDANEYAADSGGSAKGRISPSCWTWRTWTSSAAAPEGEPASRRRAPQQARG